MHFTIEFVQSHVLKLGIVLGGEESHLHFHWMDAVVRMWSFVVQGKAWHAPQEGRVMLRGTWTEMVWEEGMSVGVLRQTRGIA